MIFGPLLTAREAADFLRTSVWTLLRACTEGDLDHVMVNEKACRFTMAHLQAFVARRAVRARMPSHTDSQTVGDVRAEEGDQEPPDITGNGARATRPSADSGCVPPEDPIFRTEIDVAKILGISMRAVRRLVKEKKLRSIRLTQRKQVFTRALIDEFLRCEAGLNKMTLDGQHSAPQFLGPQNSPISLEQSRSLLKDLRKEMSPPGAGERLTHMSRRR